MSLADELLLAGAFCLLAAAALWLLFSSRNAKRDPTTPGWRVVTVQLGRERRTRAMSKEHALALASRLVYGTVRVVRLDNDQAGTTMSLAEIRAFMEQSSARNGSAMPR